MRGIERQAGVGGNDASPRPMALAQDRGLPGTIAFSGGAVALVRIQLGRRNARFQREEVPVFQWTASASWTSAQRASRVPAKFTT